ncbi:MAG TPA: Gmad2 immunoglobulin-like domain-containing protein [Actinomycetota bacterium]|nr:Gmad2 immunoglobulin-like domain-containing protein [Actinomycetota bacterium]
MSALLAVSLLGAACSDDDGPTAGRRSTPAPAGSPSASAPAPSPSAAPITRAFRLWLTTEEFVGLTVRRALVTPPQFGTAAVNELLKGPSQIEAASGFGTAIPPGSTLLGLSVEDGVATADLSEEFESGGGSLSVRLRLAQLVYTLTEFPTVRSVDLLIEGRPAATFSSEGIVIDAPLTRDDFEDLVAPIVVETPEAGETVTSPVTVAGTANVFEATVSMRILGPDNEVIAETFATATCGTGCRGTYRKNIPFQVVELTDGVIEVFESSAEDGSPLHVVRVPVVLSP